MNFRVVLTRDSAKQILAEGRGTTCTVKYGPLEQSGMSFRPDQEGLLTVTHAREVSSGPAGRVIEIQGTLSDGAGQRRVVLKHYPVYGGAKGMAIMREVSSR